MLECGGRISLKLSESQSEKTVLWIAFYWFSNPAVAAKTKTLLKQIRRQQFLQEKSTLNCLFLRCF